MFQYRRLYVDTNEEGKIRVTEKREKGKVERRKELVKN